MKTKKSREEIEENWLRVVVFTLLSILTALFITGSILRPSPPVIGASIVCTGILITVMVLFRKPHIPEEHLDKKSDKSSELDL